MVAPHPRRSSVPPRLSPTFMQKKEPNVLDVSSNKMRMMAIAWSGWLVSVAMLVLIFADGLMRAVVISVLVMMEMVLLGLLLASIRRRTDDRD